MSVRSSRYTPAWRGRGIASALTGGRLDDAALTCEAPSPGRADFEAFGRSQDESHANPVAGQRRTCDSDCCTRGTGGEDRDDSCRLVGDEQTLSLIHI